MKKSFLIIVFYCISLFVNAQKQAFEYSENWLEKIRDIYPDLIDNNPESKHEILVFDLQTGFQHWVVPHTSKVIELLGEESADYTVTFSKDIYSFEFSNLQKYDAIVLNNNTSTQPRRNIFLDVLNQDSSLTSLEQETKAKQLQENLLRYVKGGGGLMVLHSGISMLNNNAEYSEMVGGSFDYHPAFQPIKLHLTDAEHPLLKSFNGQSFVHADEPYLLKNAYWKKDFYPLLYMDTNELKRFDQTLDENIRYLAWVKQFGKGRVFYSSLGHHAKGFENPSLLAFYFFAIQYLVRDIECKDTGYRFQTIN